MSRNPPAQRLAAGLGSVEAARRSHAALHGPAPEPAAAPQVVRAQRSPQQIKHIAQLHGPATIGDGAPNLQQRVATSAVKSSPEVTTSAPAALYLKDLTLNRSFNLFQRTNQIYVAAIAWDLSGRPPQIYPSAAVADAHGPATFAMKPNETIEFIGEGLQLWPARPVTGGLYVQLVVMESDADQRKLGAKIGKVREAVEQSELATVLTTIGGAVTGGKLIAVDQAARALSRVVEVILKENGDDHVASFLGTYGAEGIAESRSERYDRRGASITLNLNTARDGAPTRA